MKVPLAARKAPSGISQWDLRSSHWEVAAFPVGSLRLPSGKSQPSHWEGAGSHWEVTRAVAASAAASKEAPIRPPLSLFAVTQISRFATDALQDSRCAAARVCHDALNLPTLPVGQHLDSHMGFASTKFHDISLQTNRRLASIVSFTNMKGPKRKYFDHSLSEKEHKACECFGTGSSRSRAPSILHITH